jgi:putative endonuclease
MDKMYFTYVLYSPGFNKIYVGFTSELTSRLMAHNDGRNTDWSSRYQPWEFLYTEEHPTKSEAMRREKQLKTCKGREFIHEMVKAKITLPPPGC